MARRLVRPFSCYGSISSKRSTSTSPRSVIFRCGMTGSGRNESCSRGPASGQPIARTACLRVATAGRTISADPPLIRPAIGKGARCHLPVADRDKAAAELDHAVDRQCHVLVGSGEEAVTGCITIDMNGAQKSSCKMVDCLGETPPLEPDNATVTKKRSNSRHRAASVSQELLEEVAKPRWIAAAIAPAAVCHSGSLCLMTLNVLLG